MVLNGKILSEKIQLEIAEKVTEITKNGGRPPHLAAILVGNDGGSQTYVAHKVKACGRVGFSSTLLQFEDTISQDFLLAEIEKLNNNPEIDGFIVQLPLPQHINVDLVIAAIKPEKDVDGFHPVNIGKMVKGLDGFLPATPAGILELLAHYNIETQGKNCVVIGRSQIVGMPVAILMSRANAVGNATVTICHSRTQNLQSFTQNADIIIAALGKPEFLTAEMVKDGVVIIDVGTTRVPAPNERGWVLKGDVDYASVAPKCAAITPVPGGVGPMTIAMLLKNTLKANLLHNSN